MKSPAVYIMSIAFVLLAGCESPFKLQFVNTTRLETQRIEVERTIESCANQEFKVIDNILITPMARMDEALQAYGIKLSPLNFQGQNIGDGICITYTDKEGKVVLLKQIIAPDGSIDTPWGRL